MAGRREGEDDHAVDVDPAVCAGERVPEPLERIARTGGYFTRGGHADAFAAVDQVADALDVTGSIELPEAPVAVKPVGAVGAVRSETGP